MKTNPSLVALLLFLSSVALYVVVVEPLSAVLNAARAVLTKDEQTLTTMQTDVTTKSAYQARIAELEETDQANCERWITPMLSSYAMRGKAFLDAIAQESGLTGVEYTEGTFRALPVPKSQLPDKRTARRSVRLKAMADYAAAASFLLRVEKELPSVCLQSMTIAPANGGGGQGSIDQQAVTMVFEWPCEGEVIK